VFPVNEKLKQKYIEQFEKLLKDGNDVLEKRIAKRQIKDSAPIHYYIPIKFFQPWKTQCITLLSIVIEPNMVLHEKIKSFSAYSNLFDNANVIFGTLKGVYEDFKSGFLDDLSLQIEENIAIDYLKQANDLLSDNDNIDYSYIPAAVLAGVVLEKSIRTLCERQTPPLVVVKENGDFKKVMPLLEELAKLGVFTQPRVREIQYWLTIRNSAAHGKSADFKPDDVKEMLRGVNNFMEDYLA